MAQNNSNSTMVTIWAGTNLAIWARTKFDGARMVTYRAQVGVSWETINAELEKMWKDVPHMRWRGWGDAETGFCVAALRSRVCHCETPCEEEESDDEDEEEEEEEEDE
jgi:hypothetical protein